MKLVGQFGIYRKIFPTGGKSAQYGYAALSIFFG